jgi:TolB-like protein
MKKFTVLVFALATAAAAFAQTAVPLDQALDSCIEYLGIRLPVGARVAVLKIEARTDGLSDYVTGSLSAKAVAQNHLTVVERGRALRALEAEQRYQLSGRVSDETAVSVGRQLGAESIITGSVTAFGDLHRMDIRVVHVETGRIQTQWSSSVRLEPALARMDAPAVAAVVRFAGTALEAADRDSLMQDVQRALEDYSVSIDLFPEDEAPPNTAYSFLITFRVSQRPSMVAADLTVAFRRGSRVLKQSDRHSYSEFNMEYLIRKGGDVIRGDRAFFQSLPGILASQ